MMERISRMGIVGVGLIGGSLALALRRAQLVAEVVGVGRSRANLDVALERGILDRAGDDPALVEGCDLVILATPVAALVRTAAAIAPHLGGDTIVTDVGSVKAGVVHDVSAALAGRARFVGGHPIAGTEESGAIAARADLFVGARCVLTPVATTEAQACARVRGVWEAVGMEVIEMAPEAHDEIVALTSHLPHLLAFALSSAAGEAASAGRDPLPFAGPSYRGATRVAASSPETWRDILLANAPALLRALGGFERQLGTLAEAIRSADAGGLEAFLRGARTSGGVGAAAGSGARGPREAPPGLEAAAVRVAPARDPLRGTVEVPGDKSIAHRALLFGGVAHGTTVVHGVGQGQDNASTMGVLRALGVPVVRADGVVRIEGRGFAGLRAPGRVLDCGNSGTTLRLVTGLLAARPFTATLDGDASLRGRPMRRIVEPLGRMGAHIETSDGKPPLTVRGRALHPADFHLDVASAQVKTALVLAGLQTTGRTTVEEPAASRDHTERLLPAFGVRLARPRANVVVVQGPQELSACEVAVPGDPSAAAFWLVAGSIVPGSHVVVRAVAMNPTRIGAIDVLRAMGARITERPCPPLGEEPVADLEVEATELYGTEIGGELMLRAIDEFPVLAVAAAVARGETRFADGAELRVKETDRIAAMASGLARLGADVEELRDGLVVRGGRLSGGEVESRGDHRVAMAFVVAALAAGGDVVLHGADAIAVSDPGFLANLARLRAEIGSVAREGGG